MTREGDKLQYQRGLSGQVSLQGDLKEMKMVFMEILIKNQSEMIVQGPEAEVCF